MSRDIPRDRTLSRKDRQYLNDRGAVGQATMASLDQNYPPSAADVEWWAKQNAPGTGPVAGDSALRDENELLRQALRDAGVPLPGEQDAEEDDDEPEEEFVPPYSDWTPGELKDELRRRKLSVSGTVPEMAARLDADDAAVKA